MKALDRWSALALLRFWLALIVAVNHLAEYTVLGRLEVVHRFGAFEAILGFLAVSGYSIGESYRASPNGFYTRRAWRIYPVYLCAMLLTFAAAPPALTPAFAGVILLNLAFLNQVVTSTSFVGPAWSLSLEVWLYAATPWFARSSTRTLAALIAASLLAYSIHTCGRSLLHWPYYSGLGRGLNLLCLSFAWLLGFMLARGPRAAALRSLSLVFAFHFALVVAIQGAHRFKHDEILAFAQVDGPAFAFRGATLLLVAACLAWASSPAAVDGARSRAMVMLGDVSYPLFLSHIPAAMLLQRWGVRGPATMLACVLAVAFVIHLLTDALRHRRSSTVQRKLAHRTAFR